MKEKLLNAEEAAERLGIKLSTVRRWILIRKIGTVRVGDRAIRIPESALEKLLSYRPAITSVPK